jgi:hypothetical protein
MEPTSRTRYGGQLLRLEQHPSPYLILLLSSFSPPPPFHLFLLLLTSSLSLPYSLSLPFFSPPPTKQAAFNQFQAAQVPQANLAPQLPPAPALDLPAAGGGIGGIGGGGGGGGQPSGSGRVPPKSPFEVVAKPVAMLPRQADGAGPSGGNNTTNNNAANNAAAGGGGGGGGGGPLHTSPFTSSLLMSNISDAFPSWNPGAGSLLGNGIGGIGGGGAGQDPLQQQQQQQGQQQGACLPTHTTPTGVSPLSLIRTPPLPSMPLSHPSSAHVPSPLTYSRTGTPAELSLGLNGAANNNNLLTGNNGNMPSLDMLKSDPLMMVDRMGSFQTLLGSLAGSSIAGLDQMRSQDQLLSLLHKQVCGWVCEREIEML